MDLADLAALLGDDVAAANQADIWVVLPAQAQGDSAAALLGEGRRLADNLGCYVHAVLTPGSDAQRAIALGADRVHLAADPAGYVARQQPEFVLLPAGHEAAAAMLAERLKAGLITRAAELSVEDETRALTGLHPVYGGEYFTRLAVVSPVKVATVDTRSLPPALPDDSRTGETLTSDEAAPEPRVRRLGPATDYTPPAWRPLTHARLIVSVGRGLRDEAGLDLARQLAQRLGAELAGDRSARDSGWIDEAHEVGVTAQEVAPEVYLALGIFGGAIHNTAITGARHVIAVHPRPDAPIFQAADTAIIAEPKDFIPLLLAALEK